MDAVNQTGKAFLSHTKLKGKLTLRLAIGNLNTEKRHIEHVWKLLNDCLASLR